MVVGRISWSRSVLPNSITRAERRDSSMRKMRFWLSVVLGLSFLGGLSGAVTAAPGSTSEVEEQTKMQTEERWIHPKCKPLQIDTFGPFVELSDGSIMAARGNSTIVSEDNGKTWSEPTPIYEGPPPGVPASGQIIKTRDGAIVLIYHDPSTSKRTRWEASVKDWPGEMRDDLWAIRTLDEGKTWIDRQQIPPEWYGGSNGCFNYGISTSSGHIVVPLQPILHSPGRWGTRTIVSADNGKTWEPGNLIDIGGSGDHDGGFEATIAELSDGRLFMLLRTNLDWFWEAYSSDHGRYWREMRQSQIDASSAPGHLLNLSSGRIALVWNRLCPEGETSFPRRPGSSLSRVDASWHRAEVSIAFSEDDCKTWTEPVVFASAHDKNAGLSYPYMFERRPGELWVVTRYNLVQGTTEQHGTLPPVKVILQEEDFAAR